MWAWSRADPGTQLSQVSSGHVWEEPVWVDLCVSHLAAAASTFGLVHLTVPSSWWANEVAVTSCPQAKCSEAVWPGRWPGALVSAGDGCFVPQLWRALWLLIAPWLDPWVEAAPAAWHSAQVEGHFQCSGPCRAQGPGWVVRQQQLCSVIDGRSPRALGCGPLGLVRCLPTSAHLSRVSQVHAASCLPARIWHSVL